MRTAAKTIRGMLLGLFAGRRHWRCSMKARVVVLVLVAILVCATLSGLLLRSQLSPLWSGSPGDAKYGEAWEGGVNLLTVRHKDPVSPAMSVSVTPFKDLCEWVTGTRSTARPPTDGAGAAIDNTADAALRTQLDSRLDRFNHVPADGGDVGRRWSAATGLPLASDRTGDEVGVRFLTVSNRLDPMMHFAAVTAAMAGVRLDIIGKGWKHFTFVKRLSLLVSYAEREGLTDADVIVSSDADAVMSGEEAESFFAAFVASTAADEAEHLTYSVLDIRMGKRLTPVLFSGESSCWHWATFTRQECPKGYEKVHALREEWVVASNVSLQHGYNRANPFKYLNAGVMVTRVWALRLLNKIFLEFAHSQKPRRKFRGAKHWWCDQSAFGGMYLDLIWWEIKSGAINGMARELSEDVWRESLYPPTVLPVAGRGPHGLPGGFLGVDQSSRLSMTIEPLMSGHGWFDISGHVVKSVENPLPALKAALAKGMPQDASPMGVVRSRHRLRVSPRPKVDCSGATPLPPECAYRDAVLGIPPGATAVVPLMWHFSGFKKSKRYIPYRTVFPWYTPSLVDTAVLGSLVHVLANVPATRVFSVDPATNTGAYLGDVALLPHDAGDDVTTADMCTRTVLKPAA